MTVPAPIVAVVGPTASGKSDLAVELALALAGEVVNVDSMQIYRGMDIGTAKLDVAERRGVDHHLLDLLHVGEPATVAEFQSWAREAISDARRREVIPILVGGSALYLRAVLDEFEFPGTDVHVREQWEAELARVGPVALHGRLAELDPAAAETILATNGRRIVRALEVIELTGRPFQASLPGFVYAFELVVQIGIAIPRDVLDERIARRVERMWKAGFVDEVRELEQLGLREGRTASRALGYRQVLDFLAGVCTEDDAREETIRLTRRFARRQDTWFKRDPRISWVPYDAEDRLAQALDAVRSGNVNFPFVKGHGTHNDFVLLPDFDGSIHGDLSADLVAALCDRRGGIGGDGVLRVIRTSSEAPWFMDYRNADGSTSQMCGNGIRVFARYLAEHGLVDPSRPVQIDSRDGIKVLTFCDDGEISVDLGVVSVGGDVKIAVDGREFVAHTADVGNPHAVAFVDDLAEAGRLYDRPDYAVEDFPQGVNVEFVVVRGDHDVAMRVFERGVGETQSCGTGACAVAAVVAARQAAELPASYRIEVPGGFLTVTIDAEHRAHLKGEALLVAEGSWLA